MNFPEKQIFPTNNLIWFPVAFKIGFLVLMTIAIETGIMTIYLQTTNFSQDEKVNILYLIIFGNLVTGFIGWLFVKIKERLEN